MASSSTRATPRPAAFISLYLLGESRPSGFTCKYANEEAKTKVFVAFSVGLTPD